MADFPYLGSENLTLLARAWQRAPQETVQLRREEFDAIVTPASSRGGGFQVRGAVVLPEALVRSPIATAFRRSLPRGARRLAPDTLLGRAFAGLIRVGQRNPAAARAQWVTLTRLTDDIVEVALHQQYRPAALQAVVQAPAPTLAVEDHSPEEAQDAWLDLWINPPADPFTALDRAARLLRLRFAPLP
jgi:hypothetical protein